MKPKTIIVEYGQLPLLVSTSNCYILLDLIVNILQTYSFTFGDLDPFDVSVFDSSTHELDFKMEIDESIKDKLPL